MSTTTITADRAALSGALFLATLNDAFAALGPVEREAFTAAVEAARRENPLDPALVEVAIILRLSGETAREEGKIDA